MSAEKTRTIDVIKQQRQVPELAKQRRKAFADMRKTIRTALEDEPKTIPELAAATGLQVGDLTYYLMTMRKYGEVTVGQVDDDDEYFYYELTKKQTHNDKS
ncbi:MAG: hypothetical protein IH597_05255 [Bacteroidales bacterium]|nr:hypothetical protein [Bacteroidales bacterium]